MIHFLLRCAGGHEFDAWFRNGAAYDTQRQNGQVECPACGGTEVEKRPMAPTVRAPDSQAAELRRLLRDLRRRVEQNSENVGGRFAEEARKIHYGETPVRNIHGNADEKEARSLQEEGVTFMRVPWIGDEN